MKIKFKIKSIIEFESEDYIKMPKTYNCLKSQKEISQKIVDFLENEMLSMIYDRLDSPTIDFAIENDLISKGYIEKI